MPSHEKNLGIAGVMALTGCMGLTVALGALLLGLWIDSLLAYDVRIASLCLLVLSVPVSLYLMVRIALAMSDHIALPVPQDANSKDTDTHE